MDKSRRWNFWKTKLPITKETPLAYPNFNQRFHIHTDTSDYKLMEEISQNHEPIAFYSRRMTRAQMNSQLQGENSWLL